MKTIFTTLSGWWFGIGKAWQACLTILTLSGFTVIVAMFMQTSAEHIAFKETFGIAYPKNDEERHDDNVRLAVIKELIILHDGYLTAKKVEQEDRLETNRSTAIPKKTPEEILRQIHDNHVCACIHAISEREKEHCENIFNQACAVATSAGFKEEADAVAMQEP